ncbi:protein-tyrosine phosphatase, partial [Backusella circina FSU 941]
MPLVPPLNFAMIASGVYRSGHPNKQNFAFLRKLGLKTIMYFAMEDYPPEMQHFVEQEGIEVLHYRTEGNKEPFVEVNPEDITHALVKLLDRRSHPVLIHCLKGKHRIGCLVGCLRKIQRWSMTSIFDEYRKFAGTKVLADQEFIETFVDEKVPYDHNYKPKWL